MLNVAYFPSLIWLLFYLAYSNGKKVSTFQKLQRLLCTTSYITGMSTFESLNVVSLLFAITCFCFPEKLHTVSATN